MKADHQEGGPAPGTPHGPLYILTAPLAIWTTPRKAPPVCPASPVSRQLPAAPERPAGARPTRGPDHCLDKYCRDDLIDHCPARSPGEAPPWPTLGRVCAAW